MRRKLALSSFLILLGAVVSGYFSYHSAASLLTYFHLASQTEARIVRWEVNEIEGKFALKAMYLFEAQNKVCSGASTLAKPWHLNEASAIAALKEKARLKWIVWFNPDNPAQSSLEKEFPAGLMVRTLLCYFVLVYFIVIIRKVVNNSTD